MSWGRGGICIRYLLPGSCRQRDRSAVRIFSPGSDFCSFHSFFTDKEDDRENVLFPESTLGGRIFCFPKNRMYVGDGQAQGGKIANEVQLCVSFVASPDYLRICRLGMRPFLPPFLKSQ